MNFSVTSFFSIATAICAIMLAILAPNVVFPPFESSLNRRISHPLTAALFAVPGVDVFAVLLDVVVHPRHPSRYGPDHLEDLEIEL